MGGDLEEEWMGLRVELEATGSTPKPKRNSGSRYFSGKIAVVATD